MKSTPAPQLLLHHAYLIIGSSPARAKLLAMLEDDCDITAQSNADFFDTTYETFTIDDARQIKSIHSTKPVSESGKKIFILTMNGITIEAQNALLKLLEEPAAYAHFFLIVPSAHLLLPTIKSRIQNLVIIEDVESPVDSDTLKLAKKLISLSKAKRLEEVKKLIDDISKEKKTKQDAIDLLNAIQAAVYEDVGPQEGRAAFETIELARVYMHDRAPSVKMLLEYVMLGI